MMIRHIDLKRKALKLTPVMYKTDTRIEAGVKA
jgi:hypothetical protein